MAGAPRQSSPRTARGAASLDAAGRRLALGGVVGCVGFVVAWAVAGANTAGYSPVDDAISRLAAQHAPHRAFMTPGFLAFGLGLPAYALALRRALPGWAWTTAFATGASTIGVALAPLDTTAGDRFHSIFAIIGYITLAATPVLAIGAFVRRGAPGWARYSAITGAISGGALLATAAGPLHGLLQRAGLGISDVWIVVTALQMWRFGHLAGTPAEHHQSGGDAARPPGP
jgi:Protein of unknown function (DUF998)